MIHALLISQTECKLLIERKSLTSFIASCGIKQSSGNTRGKQWVNAMATWQSRQLVSKLVCNKVNWRESKTTGPQIG